MQKLFKLNFIIIYFIPLCAAFGQTAADIEGLLGEREVTCEQAAWFTLAAALEEPPAGPNAAFALALERGWLNNTEPDDTITLGKLSFLIMRAFEIKGGMMFSLLPGPRYAYRSLVSRSCIQGTADPAMTVSGERFLVILGKILSAGGGES